MQPIAMVTKGILTQPCEDECASDELTGVIEDVDDIAGTIEEC